MILRPFDHGLADAERQQRGWAGRELRTNYLLGRSLRYGHLERQLATARLHTGVLLALVLAGVLIAIVGILCLVPVGTDYVKPGIVVPAAEMMVITPAPRVKPTVSAVKVQRRQARLIDVVLAPVRRHDVIEKDDPVIASVIRRFGKEFVTASFAYGKYVGLQAAGDSVRFTARQATVAAVMPNTRASKAGLKTGDVVASVGGRPVSSAYEFVRQLDAAPRGVPVPIALRGGQTRMLSVPPATELGRLPHNHMLGTFGLTVVSEDPRVEGRTSYSAEFRPTFDGGSAGLAIALAFYQAAGHGANAPQFAATGGLYPDGSVGWVDSVERKTLGVQQAGLRYFLVPADTLDEARKAAAPDVEIVPVDSFSDAATWLDAWDKEKVG